MAGLASKLNGKKGGRPKGTKTEVTIAREKAREYLARRVEEEIQPIANKLIEKASTGDVPAIKELFDRAWGKSRESVDITSKGEPITGFNYIIPKDDSHTDTES